MLASTWITHMVADVYGIHEAPRLQVVEPKFVACTQMNILPQTRWTNSYTKYGEQAVTNSIHTLGQSQCITVTYKYL